MEAQLNYYTYQDHGGSWLSRLKTSNLSKAHVTRDSSGPATLAISVQHAIK